ncbi:MAG: PD-(D/E)XK nuclease family transposase [Lachnospiraceae bacterium]|nr:PD-(D/E)XK nuclease family transposase [Lachnospiraceae bacterium]
MTLEKEHLKDLKRIKEFRLIDDDFMNVCFDGNIEGVELLLRIILDKPDIVVEKVTTQKIMKNLLGRDVWFDIDAHDSSGKEYDIEIQRSDKGADKKRARYHSSILDAHLLKPKEDFSVLPETFVIFITEHDVIGNNKPIYRIERYIEETGERFNDGEHIVYVNGASENGTTELGKLMHDFLCEDPNDMYYIPLAEKVRYFKEDEKGVATMCKALEDMRNEVARETARETAEKTKVENALNLLKLGKLSFEEIANAIGLSVERITELARMQPARP